MSSERLEARRPPRNSLAMPDGPRTRLVQALQLFADLQVYTVRRDVKSWVVSAEVVENLDRSGRRSSAYSGAGRPVGWAPCLW